MLIAFYLCSPRQISRLRETPEEFRRRIHFEVSSAEQGAAIVFFFFFFFFVAVAVVDLLPAYF
jgi:hypothetical protein